MPNSHRVMACWSRVCCLKAALWHSSDSFPLVTDICQGWCHVNSAGFGAGSTACALHPYFCFKRCTAGGKLLLSAQTWEIRKLPSEIWAGFHISVIHFV